MYQFASPAVYLQDEESSYSAALASIQRLEADMSDLDTVTTEPQLTKGEIGILFVSAIGAALAPLLVSEKVVELLVPSAAALSAAVGISAEYAGKLAVANGKEVAATTLQAAAEAEALLASAERVYPPNHCMVSTFLLLSSG